MNFEPETNNWTAKAKMIKYNDAVISQFMIMVGELGGVRVTIIPYSGALSLNLVYSIILARNNAGLKRAFHF